MCHDPLDPSLAREATRIERLAIADGRIPVHWFEPDAQRAIAVRLVLLPDIRGPHSFYQNLAGRLADDGVQTALLDYFWRLPDIDPNDMPAASQRRMRFNLPQGRSDVEEALSAIKSRDTSPIVVMGFCLGGTLAMLCQMTSAVAGSIVYYGLPRNKRPPTPLEPYSVLDVLSAGAPMLGFWGDEEKSVDLNSVDELGRRLTEFGQQHEIIRYPDVGHAFLTFDDRSPAYAASVDSWNRSMSFLRRTSWGMPPLTP